MRLATRKEIYDWIRGIAAHEDNDLGKPVVRQPGVSKGIIPAAYTTGNPQVQQWWETSTTLGSKTHKVIQFYGSRLAAPAASDSIAIGHDPDGNKEIIGKLVNVGSAVVDADYIMGLRPVAPGNTLLLTANAERSTTSDTFSTVKRFFVTRPGRYRVKAEFSQSGVGASTAQVGIELSDGTITVASSTMTGAGTYPTFSATQSTDMTVTIGWGMFLVVQLKNTIAGQTAYIQNVTVNYADASAALTPLDSVLTD